MRLADVIGRWIGRAEIVLLGADDDLREGEEALSSGDPQRARAAAHRVLARAPDSPIGLALLADACEAAGLDAELGLTLEELARRAPSRAEVWLRLSRARSATGAAPPEVRDALVRALAVVEAGSSTRRDTLLELADLDLAQGDGVRADLWLERVAGDEPAVVLRRAEAKLLAGAARAADKLLSRFDWAPTDGRAALARGRALSMLGDGAAFVPLLRALVLDVPGASEALSAALAHVPSEPGVRTRVRSVVDAKGEQELARWRAAFARAEGARDAAREALREAVDAGDRAAARPLLDAAIEDRDARALDSALLHLPEDDPTLEDARRMARALSLEPHPPRPPDLDGTVLDTLGSISHPLLSAWAGEIARDIARAWVPSSGSPAQWSSLLARLDTHAHAAGDLATAASIADLAAERSRPVRLAIVGEFNAGKSTFINALIGAEVAPTGVVPTTATLHHLRWGPDPFAKILFSSGHVPPERMIALGDLRAALKSLDGSTVARVELRMPLASLVRVEVLDTPGFNAGDAEHARVARAALSEADVAVWLLDATQAMKASERAVLEEATALRLPVQILVNKADRLAPGDVARVLETVRAGLTEAGVASLRPPITLSAKRALAGKLGDARALTDSGWGSVESLLEESIVARSDELKERALRRRAASLVDRLVHVCQERVSTEEKERQAQDARAHGAARAAGRIEREAADAAARIAESVRPVAQAWSHDLEMIFVGRDRQVAARDPVLTSYRVDRALATLAPALSAAVSSVARECGASVSAAELAQGTRAIVRTAASSATSPQTPRLDTEVLVSTIARAAVATLVDHLFALSSVEAPPVGSRGTLRELEAFGAALRAPLD